MAISVLKQALEIEELVGSRQGQALLRAEAIVPGAGRDAIETLMSEADLVIGQVDVQEGRVVLEGTALCQAVYRQGDEASLRSLTAQAQLNHAFELPGAASGMPCRVAGEVEHVEAKYENGHMVFLVSVGLKLQLWRLTPAEIVTGIEGVESLETETETIRSVRLAAEAGVETLVVNLYIGGCSLKTHWENMQGDLRAYHYEKNGVGMGLVSLREALTERAWDVVTFQQASHDSGLKETYFPYLRELSAYAKELAPGARQFLHQTWAYAEDSTHEAFVRYHHSQSEMFACLKAAYGEAARELGLPLIRSGELVQRLRAQGLGSLCRDGFHIEIPHGRAALALLWLKTLSGVVSPFSPVGADAEIMAKIRACVAEMPEA